MDSRLHISLNIDETTFQAIDSSPYERWIHDGHFDEDHEHFVIHRLVNITNDENELVKLSQSVVSTVDEIRETWEAANVTNGLYYYQKLILPIQGHPTNANEILWYDTTSESVIFYDVDVEEETRYDVSDDFDEIYDLAVSKTPDNCFYFDDYSFTTRRLVECYLILEKERIDSYIKNNCRGNCSPDKYLDSKIDLLLGAIMVINDLIDKGEFFEAQRILSMLDTCGSLCGDYEVSLKRCGCGKA